MLCKFCSSIDLDQLATDQGFKHHASCTDLLQSARNGCESCELIRDSQWIKVGGNLQDDGVDLGLVETQIFVRAVNQKPGGNADGSQQGQDNDGVLLGHNSTSPESPFLWSFLNIATSDEHRSANYLSLRTLVDRAPGNWHILASSWLKDCLTSHEACSPQPLTKARPPTRVIDVGTLDGSQHPFLYTSGNDVQEWVTMSYCWEIIQPLKTTNETLSYHQQELPMSKLPRLFYDAILITRRLGYRYLWIDSLCIIQDNKDDWKEQTSNMTNIYKNCVFTISSDNCRDNRDRILGNHIPVGMDYIQLGCCSSKNGFNSVMYAFKEEQWDRDQLHENFSELRAWALHEATLSPRTLKWTASCIIWNCRSMRISEQNPVAELQTATKTICLSPDQLEVASQKYLKENPGEENIYDPLQIWYHLVRQFRVRKITFEEEALPAISGLAKEVGIHTNHEYLAGIWAQDFHNGLLWSVDHRALYPDTYVAPSWSWASIKSSVLVRSAYIGPTGMRYSRQKLALTPIAEILQTDIAYSGKDGFGSIISGKLLMSAPFRTAGSFDKNKIRLPLVEDQLPDSGDDPSAYKIYPDTITCWLDDYTQENDENFSEVQLQLNERGIAFVQIGMRETKGLDGHILVPEDSKNPNIQKWNRTLQDKTWALILEPVISGAVEWKRIGVARIADDLVAGWEIHTVTVI